MHYYITYFDVISSILTFAKPKEKQSFSILLISNTALGSTEYILWFTKKKRKRKNSTKYYKSAYFTAAGGCGFWIVYKCIKRKIKLSINQWSSISFDEVGLSMVKLIPTI